MHDTDGALTGADRPTTPTPTDEEVRLWARVDAAGKATPDVSAWLRRPENLDRWRAALTREAQTIQGGYIDWRARVRQAKADSWPVYQAMQTEYASWCAKTRYREQALTDRIAECKRLQRERDTEKHAAFKGDLVSRIETAEWNIARLNRAVRAIAEAVKSGQAVDA